MIPTLKKLPPGPRWLHMIRLHAGALFPGAVSIPQSLAALWEKSAPVMGIFQETLLTTHHPPKNGLIKALFLWGGGIGYPYHDIWNKQWLGKTVEMTGRSKTKTFPRNSMETIVLLAVKKQTNWRRKHCSSMRWWFSRHYWECFEMLDSNVSVCFFSICQMLLE